MKDQSGPLKKVADRHSERSKRIGWILNVEIFKDVPFLVVVLWQKPAIFLSELSYGPLANCVSTVSILGLTCYVISCTKGFYCVHICVDASIGIQYLKRDVPTVVHHLVFG